MDDSGIVVLLSSVEIEIWISAILKQRANHQSSRNVYCSMMHSMCFQNDLQINVFLFTLNQYLYFWKMSTTKNSGMCLPLLSPSGIATQFHCRIHQN